MLWNQNAVFEIFKPIEFFKPIFKPWWPHGPARIALQSAISGAKVLQVLPVPLHGRLIVLTPGRSLPALCAKLVALVHPLHGWTRATSLAHRAGRTARPWIIPRTAFFWQEKLGQRRLRRNAPGIVIFSFSKFWFSDFQNFDFSTTKWAFDQVHGLPC